MNVLRTVTWPSPGAGTVLSTRVKLAGMGSPTGREARWISRLACAGMSGMVAQLPPRGGANEMGLQPGAGRGRRGARAYKSGCALPRDSRARDDRECRLLRPRPAGDVPGPLQAPPGRRGPRAAAGRDPAGLPRGGLQESGLQRPFGAAPYSLWGAHPHVLRPLYTALHRDRDQNI